METNIGGYHRIRWARGVLIPSPCVTDSRTLILWSQDLVPSFVRFSDIPFPYGINILVATLFIFRERATAGDSAGDYLSKSILAFVCFILLGVYLFYVYILYICLHVLFSACISCLFLLAHHAYGLYFVFLGVFCSVLQVGGLCEVKGPLPRPVTHRISVDAHVDSRGPCYDRVQHGVPQLGEVLSWNTVSGTLAATNSLYPMGTVDPSDH